MTAYDGGVFVHEDFVSAYRWAKMKKLVGGFKHVLCLPRPAKMIQLDEHIIYMCGSHGQKRNIATSNDLAPNGSGSVKEIPLFKDMKIHLGEILQLGQISRNDTSP